MAVTAAASGIAANGTVPWAGATSSLSADPHTVTVPSDLTAFDTTEALHAASAPRHMVSPVAPATGDRNHEQAILTPASLYQPTPARSRAASHQATAMPAKRRGHAALGRPKPVRSTARHAATHSPTPARPYLIYDSVTPAAIPAGRNVAAYSDGPYAASPSEVAGRGHVMSTAPIPKQACST
jgi:hypothetical protein